MTILKNPEQEPLPMEAPEGSDHTGRFIAIFLILAALILGEIYVVARLGALRRDFDTQQAKMRKEVAAELQAQFSGKLAALEQSSAQQLEVLKQELEAASKRMGLTGRELARARALVGKLQQEQQAQTDALKHEIALKADQQQLGTLTQDVSATRTDLDKTKNTVATLVADLGMARSELGTLIARNHQEIEYLRKLGERDYFEFTLERKRAQRIAGVGLTLKKANVKRHRFDLSLYADDMEIEKKGRTINEPIFFYVGGSKRPYELVVNQVQSNKVVGYLSTPKGAVETASR